MRSVKIWIAFFIGITFFSNLALAMDKRIATNEDILQLKRDLLDENLKVDISRLKDIRSRYGEPAIITDSKKKVTFEYTDLILEFDKQVLFRKWEYDFSQPSGWSKDVNKLRTNLEGGQIIGVEYPIERLYKDYKTPTLIEESSGDGEMSYYHYAELKLTFENVCTLRSWKGKKMDQLLNSGVLSSVKTSTTNQTPAPVVPPAVVPEVKPAVQPEAAAPAK
ncbi:MAG: hypothetical protein HQL25_03210 [Candidatus Omnitrophica bacterium]|nr:hypothetical protein [Candidatus Omnitrophota bacterium]